MDLKITLNLQNDNRVCKVLANSVLITAEVSPIQGKTINDHIPACDAVMET